MNKEYTLKNIKKHLKQMALYIKINKQLRKTVYCNLDGFDQSDISMANRYSLEYLRTDYRYLHIAYCLYRGRTIDQIENGSDFIPFRSRKYLDKIETDMGAYNEKTLCNNS